MYKLTYCLCKVGCVLCSAWLLIVSYDISYSQMVMVATVTVTMT